MKPVDAILNVAEFTPEPGSSDACFAVTLTPVGPGVSGDAVKLREVHSDKQLRALLTGVGLSRDVIGQIFSGLSKEGWTSIRTAVPYTSLREW